MFKKMFTNGAGRIVFFALVILAPCAQNTLFGQALNMDGQSGNVSQPLADVVPSPNNGLGAPMTPGVHAARNETANPTHDNDPVIEKTTPSRASTL